MNANAVAPTAARISHQYSIMNFERPRRRIVGPGSASYLHLKTTAKLGSTKVRRNTVVPIAMRAMMPG